MLKSTWNISILPAHMLVFSRWLNENANSGNCVHKAALHSQTLLYQALQALWNENETNRTNQCRLASRKGGVWKNESLSESFGSRWASKVKINAYYKTMKVSFDLASMSTCCWGLQKPKYEPFITYNMGTLITYILTSHFIKYTLLVPDWTPFFLQNCLNSP